MSIAWSGVALFQTAGRVDLARGDVFIPGPDATAEYTIGVSNAGVIAGDYHDPIIFYQTTPTWLDRHGAAGTLQRPAVGSDPDYTSFLGYYTVGAGGTILIEGQADQPDMPHYGFTVRWRNVAAPGELLAPLNPDPTTAHYVSASSVNVSGVVAGLSDGQAVYWPATSTTPVALPLTTPGFSTAQFISDGGAVAGRDTTGPVRWASLNSAPTRLLPIPNSNSGDDYAQVQAINRSGAVVGASDLYEAGTERELGTRPTLWPVGQSTAVALPLIPGTLQTSAGRADYGLAGTTAINTAGTIIGYEFTYSRDDPTEDYAVRWSALPGHAPTELQPLAGAMTPGRRAKANAINAAGWVAGNSGDFVNARGYLIEHATIWSPDSGIAIDLNTRLPAATLAGWTLETCAGISDTGFVSGSGAYDPDGVAGPIEETTRLFSVLIPEAGTYGKGDADFNTSVDFNDLLLLAKHYNQPSNGSVDAADFDLNGVTDFNDLLALAKNYNTSLNAADLAEVTSERFASDVAFAQSLVPEPTALLGTVLFAQTVGRRRRLSR